MLERLQKFMAECGVASRRKSEEIILSGRVKVNDMVVTELGYKIDLDKDNIYVDNKLVKKEENMVYIALNKPIKYISSVQDERGRKTILDLVQVKERIYPIGRLDYDTSGLILLTNDGEVYNKVIHPRQQVKKVYIAEIHGLPTNDEIQRFCRGVDIGGYITADAEFKIIKKDKASSTAEIIIHEGKNRQVRKMCEAINHPVISLKRISIGKIKLGELKLGSYRYLNNSEVEYLKSL
jgi:23S rRNA pseudouridine2605 synthase